MQIVITRADHPEVDDLAAVVFRGRWPEFVFHDEVPQQFMGRVGQHFARYDVMVLDGGVVVAGSWGVPFAGDGTYVDLPDGHSA